MSSQPPTPPSTVPTSLVDALDDCSAEELRDVVQYAQALAEYRDRKARLREEDDADGREPENYGDLPDDVPSKATITIKEINDNRYYYWQWRDGDRIKSKYKAPVDQTE